MMVVIASDNIFYNGLTKFPAESLLSNSGSDPQALVAGIQAGFPELI